MTDPASEKPAPALSTSSAFRFVVTLGIVNLFADMTYEGASSINGPFLGLLGASAAAIGVISGVGEFLGYSLRLVAGYVADKTGKYWLVTFVGYGINLFAVPALALAGNWPLAAGLVIAERVGRAIRRALDYGRRPIVERMREHARRLDPREAVPRERKRAEERRRDREGVNRRTDIVHESGSRQLRRARAAADGWRRLVDHHAPSGLRHRNRGGETVGARPDDDCIRVRHRASVPLTLTLGIAG
jgi:hypothetical protein